MGICDRGAKGASKCDSEPGTSSRRSFLKAAATVGTGALAGAPTVANAMDFDIESFFQKNFRELSDEELSSLLDRLERKYTEKYDKPVTVKATGPIIHMTWTNGTHRASLHVDLRHGEVALDA